MIEVRTLLGFAILSCVVRTDLAAPAKCYGPWEVRRARTSDAARAGGYPTWRVVFRGPKETPDVSIEGDTGPARGVIFIGRRVRASKDELTALAFSYKTYCALKHRSGSLEVVIFTPEVWDKLGTTPRTEVIYSAAKALRPIWKVSIHKLSGEDVTEFRPLDEDITNTMGTFVRAMAGRDLVLAVVWTAAHTCPERAAFKRLRLVAVKPENPMKALFERLDLDQPDLAEVKRCVARRDFAAAADALVAHFRKRFPAPPHPKKLHRGTWHDVDMALQNRFRSVGSDEYFELGKDFDWSRNAISDREWLLHLQWHHIILSLLEAGAIKNDPRYTQKATELIRDWIPKNYPGSPWSWRTLEVSLRAMNWLTMYPYLLHAPSFSREDHVQFLYTLCEHFDYLLPEKRFHSGHNFGTTESKALLRGGMTLPEFKHARLWRDTAWKRFEHEIRVAVLPDGAQRELTTGYHCGVLNSFFSAAQDALKIGIEPSKLYWERLEKMHEYTMFLTKPDGTQPALGDSWRARPLSLLARGAKFFKRDDMLFVATEGREGKRPDYLDTQLPAAGYYVMRTAWTDDPDGVYLLLDAARVWGGWHQHYDALGIILYAYGKTLTPDAGPFSYGHPLRRVFQSTAAHSTVCVDERNQNTSPCTLHAFFSSDALSFIDASQQGYEGVTHRRQILFARPVGGRPPYFIVIDRLSGKGAHTLDAHFHLLKSKVAVDANRMEARTTSASGANVLVRAVYRDGVEFQCGKSWIMTSYGKKTDRPDVRFRQRRTLPAVFVTLLAPFKGAAAPKLTCALIGRPDPAGAIAVEVKSASGRDVLFAALEPAEATFRGVAVAGRAGLLRWDARSGACRETLVKRMK